MSGQWTRIAGEFNKNSSAADARGRRLTERRRRRGGSGRRFSDISTGSQRGDFPHNQAALMLLTFVPGFVSPLAHFYLPNKRTQRMGKK